MSATPASPAAHNAAAASFAALVDKLDYLSAEDVELVRRAYRFADESHLGQLRNSGEPYITHPIAVAAQCAEWKLDAPALQAALMHDVLEDSHVTKAEMIERFGAPVAELVDGLTKLDKLQFSSREENQAESFRKMLLAMSRDVRVILIKLADRTHNMRTMSDMPRSKWHRIASETLDVYAPIAYRLGLNATYIELQDLAFKHLRPWRYAVLSKALAKVRSRRQDLLKKVEADVVNTFERHGLKVQVHGRAKTLFSIYRKMHDKQLSFAEVTDMYGFRLVLPSITDCYTALGLLHQLYKPVPGKFKDHIAIPKINGYQSLHTTLVGPAGVNIEFQMRTEPMHVVAESGVAAHWLYKAKAPKGRDAERLGAQWLQSLLDIQNETRDATEFWDHVKVDLFPEAVYVFTPKNEIISLPRGATVVDFAYAIHSNVGDRTIAAKVNGEQAPLRTALNSGDRVEVVTAPASSPNPAWLGFVRTARARSRIRHHLKTLASHEAEALGQKLLNQALRAEGIDHLPTEEAILNTLWDKTLRFTGNRSREELFSDIGLGKRIASMVAKRMVGLLGDAGVKKDVLLMTMERYGDEASNATQGAIMLDGSETASIQYAACCHPIPGDEITGYLGRGEGLVVHRTNCLTAQRQMQKDSERFIAVDWSEEPVRPFNTAVSVSMANTKGVLATVAAAVAADGADIIHVDMGAETYKDDARALRFILAVRDAAHLDATLKRLQRTAGVMSAQRVTSKG